MFACAVRTRKLHVIPYVVLCCSQQFYLLCSLPRSTPPVEATPLHSTSLLYSILFCSSDACEVIRIMSMSTANDFELLDRSYAVSKSSVLRAVRVGNHVQCTTIGVQCRKWLFFTVSLMRLAHEFVGGTTIAASSSHHAPCFFQS